MSTHMGKYFFIISCYYIHMGIIYLGIIYLGDNIWMF